MKKFLSTPFFLSIILALSFGACKMAQFDKYPGEQLSTFPPELQGNYLTFSDNEKDRDTAYVQVNSDRFVLQYEGNETYVLGKKYFLSKVDEVYYLSEKNAEGRYFIFGIREYDKYILLQPFMQVTQKERERLEKYFQPAMTSDSTVYYKMDNAQTAEYYQKFIRRKDGLKLYKVK